MKVDLFNNKFGFTLNSGEETFNVLHIDQRTFQTRVLAYLTEPQQQQPNHAKNNLTSFTKFLETYFEANELNFLVALLPTRNSVHVQNSHSSVQDSLVRILLELEPLQSTLLEFLIIQICDYTETKELEKLVLGINMNVAIYCINQFRYLPRIFAPKAFCTKLLELVLALSHVQMKREVIRCVADVMGDECEHDSLIDELETFLSDPELVSVTLEAIADLSLNQANIERIVAKIFKDFTLFNEKVINLYFWGFYIKMVLKFLHKL